MNRHILGPSALIGVLLLAGCADADADAGPTGAPSGSHSATPEPGASEAPGNLVFFLPDDCRSMLPSARIDAFEAAGLELLGGPGGVYGEDYLLEPTPEEIAGGITCIWGDEAAPESVVTISAAPVSVSNRAAIVDDLLAQGLNEAEADDALTYSELGDEVSAPAILNVVRRDSWISVIAALGGQERFADATTIAEEVASLAYREG